MVNCPPRYCVGKGNFFVSFKPISGKDFGQERLVKAPAAIGVRAAFYRQVRHLVFGVGAFHFTASRAALIRDNQAHVANTGIILEFSQRNRSFRSFVQISLAVNTVVCRVWRLCMAVRTGLQAGPPVKIFFILIELAAGSRGKNYGGFRISRSELALTLHLKAMGD